MNWDSLISGFREFGGTINNITQRNGPFGLGLFPIDVSKPVELRVPDQLLVSTENIALVNGQITLKDSHNYPTGFNKWYQDFQKHYSWGADGRRSIEFFENELTKLPGDAINLLQRFGLYNEKLRSNPHNDENKILDRFIATRRINKNGKNVLMPLMELANHSANASTWGFTDTSIFVSGQYTEEILVRYSPSDPLHRLLQYGFCCDEPMAFSIALNFAHYGENIVVIGGIGYQPQTSCEIQRNQNSVRIDKPIIGIKTAKRKPRSLFLSACKEAGIRHGDELFDKIHMFNTKAMLKLYKSVQGENTWAALQLREACLNQLNMLTEHIGVR